MNLSDLAKGNFDALPYWQAANEGRLVVARCDECDRAHHYPREVCPFCRSRALSWTPASGRGTIYSLAVSRSPDGTRVLAYVTLEEGPTMMTKILGAPPDITIGSAVTVDFEQHTDGLVVPVFRVNSNQDAGDPNG